MTKTEIMDLTKIAQSYPVIPEVEISRENILETIDKLFELHQVVIIEGDDGMGKTNILSQFVRKHPNNALSSFITPNCVWGYDPYFIKQELFEQMRWVLDLTDPIEDHGISESNFGTCFLNLIKKAKREKTLFYFVIDGLSDIPEARKDIQDEILTWLPFSFGQQFRFLLSGDFSNINPQSLKGLKIKSFPLSGFNFGETKKYLSEFVTDQSSLEVIYQILKGIPGYVESIKRILIDGKNVQTVIDEMPTHLPDLFELEWETVLNDEEQLILLAIIAYGRWKSTIDDLSSILNISSEETYDRLKKLRFISINDNSSEVTFVSEIFRKFAITRLKDYKKRANEILVDSLLKKGDSYLSYKYLPMLYQELGQSNELLNYLSSEEADKLVDHFKSLLPIQQKVILGVTTALKLNRVDELVKFSMQSSALKGLWETKILHSEIEALMSLNKYDDAVSLAHTNVIYEEKLQLLCLIAKSKTEQGLSPDEDLIEQIKELYKKIDFEIIGDDAIDIASNLIYSVPELAIDLVEKTSKFSKNESLNWGFAKLSFAVLSDSSRKKVKFDAIENIKRTVTDPAVKNFSTGLTLLLGEYSPQKVISESKKMNGPEEQIFLLRNWTKENKRRGDAQKVIDYALTIILKSTELSPTAKILSELSLPLPNIRDAVKIKMLVGRFDTLTESAKKLGPTKEYVKFQLILADAESRYDMKNAGNRILEVYSYINEIKDVLLKTECHVGMMVTLKRIDPFLTIEEEHKVYSSIQNNLDSQIENLLINTANHYETSKDIIKFLTQSDPDRAIDLAMKLNTEDRRDHALFEFVRVSLKRPLEEIKLQSVKDALSKIQDKEVADISIYEVIERFSKKENQEISSDLLYFINESERISNYAKKCMALAYAFSILKQKINEHYSKYADRILHLLRDCWGKIDVEWEQIDTGYKIVKIISTIDMELSRNLLSYIEEKRKNYRIDSGPIATSYINFIRLAIRSLAGLMPRKLISPDDIEELSNLINQISSFGIRANLWSRLAIRYYINGDNSNCEKIVVEHVKPLLQNLIKEQSDDKVHAIVECAPALYCAHRYSAFETIEILPKFEKDYAYYQICEFLIKKHPLSDPFDTGKVLTSILNYTSLLDICEILEKMKHDALIYVVIENITENMKMRKKRMVLTIDQQNDLIKKLNDVVLKKFPDKDNIQHNGYVIASKALILSLYKGQKKDWDDLIEEALKIPNRTDRAYVLLIIVVNRPSKFSGDRIDLINQCINIIDTIPSSVEKIERYESIASNIIDFEPDIGKKCIRIAMEQSLMKDDREYATSQQRLVDLAYRYDPDLANSLASMTDEDPARRIAKVNIQNRIHELKLKKELIENSQTIDVNKNVIKDYPNAAWMRLGALNSKRIETVHINETGKLSESAAFLPINASYPIFSYIIENAIVRYSDTDQAGKYFRSFYRAASTAALLSLKLAQRSSDQRDFPPTCSIRTCGEKSLIIRSGEREKADQFIIKWFEENANQYLKICDPYFGPDELDLIKQFTSINPDVEIHILTSKKHQNQEKIQGSLEEHYRKRWKSEISENDPAYTDFVVVGTKESGELPIHDRWWVSDLGGLRFGASYNGIGVKKDSEISTLVSIHFIAIFQNYSQQKWVHFSCLC